MAVADCNRRENMLTRLALGLLAALACATVGYSQAAAEYALRSSGSAASAGGAHIGGCKLDSTVVTCLSRAYPKATIIVVVLLTLLTLRWLAKAYTSRR